jgi:hypothetical protein
MSISPLDALPLFFAMLVLTELGRKLHARTPEHKSSSAIEGAIFGLFGLLLAFTFSGAIGRYDTHRKLVTEEVNDISAAYLRLDLLPKDQQNQFRQNFRAYVTSRLDRFDSIRKKVNPSAKKRSGFRRLSGQMQLRRQRTVTAVTLTVQDCFCLP